jgi:hypothetical protein
LSAARGGLLGTNFNFGFFNAPTRFHFGRFNTTTSRHFRGFNSGMHSITGLAFSAQPGSSNASGGINIRVGDCRFGTLFGSSSTLSLSFSTNLGIALSGAQLLHLSFGIGAHGILCVSKSALFNGRL